MWLSHQGFACVCCVGQTRRVGGGVIFWGGGSRRGITEADRYETEGMPEQSSYLNPQPVPPRTIAARRIAPAMEPMIILVPLGPVEGGREGRRGRGGGGGGQKQNNTTKTHIRTRHQTLHRSPTPPSPEIPTLLEREREKSRRGRETELKR